MKGILTFDINERNGNKITSSSLDDLKEKLQEFADDFWKVFDVENADYDGDAHDEADEKGEDYDIPELFEIELTNADINVAENGYTLMINR